MAGHDHKFVKLTVYPIKKHIQKDYHGTPGDKAFLSKRCRCGEFEHHDYGLTKDMEIKLKELTNERI